MAATMTTSMTRRLSICAVGAALALPLIAAGGAVAQDNYPNRPVRLVVGAGPGGNPDVLGRLLADRLSRSLGQPFVVENMPGAGGMVAANSVGKAAPDGYTLMLGDSGALAINPVIAPKLNYAVEDFAPITALATVPTVFLANPSVKAETLPEFIALAKKQPGKLTYGSAGPGSIHHLTMAIFADEAGIDLLHVPYRGGTAMVQGLMAGEIQTAWSGIPNVIPLIEAGKLRAYCVSILERSKSLPKVPTCDEVGQKGFDVATMIGLQAPAGTPQAIIDRLQQAAAKAVRDPEMAKRMEQLGMVVQENGNAHYVEFIKEDLARYGEAAKRLGLKIE